MKASKVIIATCLVSALLAVLIFFKRQGQAPQLTQVTQDNSIGQELTVLPSAQRSSKSGNVVSSQSSVESTELWNGRAGFEQVEKWRESRGYLSDTDFQIYENYGVETIKQLANAGDVKAIRTLARIYVREGAEPQLVMSTLREATIRGFSESLILEGMMTKTPRHFPQFSGPDGDELYKKDMLEALAIFKAASIRGDREVEERITETRLQLTLAPDDDRYIEQRGTEIYNELEEKRKSLGLGPFDNSIPPLVNDYYDVSAKGFPIN